MIPLFSLGYLICFLIILPAVIKTYFSFREIKLLSVLYWFSIFASLLLVLFLRSLPGLLVKDLILIQLIMAISRALSFVPLIFTTFLCIEFWGWATTRRGAVIKKIYFWVIILTMALIILFSVSELGPVEVWEHGRFIFYDTSENPRIPFVSGLIGVLNLIVIVYTFVYQGIKIKEKKLRIRNSLLLGMMILLTIGLAVHIIGFKPELLWPVLIVIACWIISCILFLLASFYIIKREKYVKKII